MKIPTQSEIRLSLLSWFFRNNLNRLAELFGSDKWGSHWYTQHYQRYLSHLRHLPLNILEIGIGGYDDPQGGGESLRMWKTYFRNSKIVGIDLHSKRHIAQRRIDVRQLDQTDRDGLISLSNEYGGFDIVIDDGSHLNADVITTFRILFPILKANGVYAIEDMQTSYWPTFGGGINNEESAMEFIKKRLDGLNYREIPDPCYQLSEFDRCRDDSASQYAISEFDKHIVEIAAFHNLIVVRKGVNDEPSNIPLSVEREAMQLKISNRCR